MRLWRILTWPVFCLVLDKSADISNMKRLDTCVRYIDEDMNVKTGLFRNSETVGGRADAMLEEVMQLLTEKNLDGRKPCSGRGDKSTDTE